VKRNLPTEENLKITPEKYKKILDGLQIETFYLQQSKSFVEPTIKPGDLQIAIEDKATYRNLNDSEVMVEQTYTLKAKDKGKKKTYLTIECTFNVLFSTKHPITDEFFDIYKDTSLPLNTWPFFREFVNNMTARMNIPPLTLPLLKRG